MRAVRVLIVDDSQAVRAALRDVVDATSGFEIVAEAGAGEAAIELAAETRPDLALVDVRLPGLGGIATAKRIAAVAPGTTVLMMSADRSADVAGYAVLGKSTLSPDVLRAYWERTHASGLPSAPR
jgi:DNA-binding NarL/FixJ family response regulator